MASKTVDQIFPIPSFDGGVQRRSNRFLAQKTEVFYARNADFTTRLGAIMKSLGYTQKGNAFSGTAIGSGALNRSDDTNKLVGFSSSEQDALVFNTGTSNWDTQGLSGISDATSVVTDSFLDYLFSVWGHDNPVQEYSGSAWHADNDVAAVNVVRAPRGRYLIQYLNRVYIFNININQASKKYFSRAWYSDLPKNEKIKWGIAAGTSLDQTSGSPIVTRSSATDCDFLAQGIKVGDPLFILTGTNAGEYEVLSVDSAAQLTLTENLANTQTGKTFWVGGNWFDVARDNGDIGMGLGKNGDRLLLFKRFSLWKFLKTGSVDTDSLIQVKGVPGTTNHHSITNIRDYTFYYSDKGIWRYNGSTADLVSGPVKDIIDGVTDPTKAVGWQVNDRVLKMFVGAVSNSARNLSIANCVLSLDAYTNVWSVESLNDSLTSSLNYIDTSIPTTYVFGGDVFKTDNGNTQNGSNFVFEVESYFYYPISPEVMVNYPKFCLFGENIRSLDVRFKFTLKEDGTTDADWISAPKKIATDKYIEYHFPEDMHKASGFAFKVSDMSGDVQPVIERGAMYYSGGQYR